MAIVFIGGKYRNWQITSTYFAKDAKDLEEYINTLAPHTDRFVNWAENAIYHESDVYEVAQSLENSGNLTNSCANALAEIKYQVS